MRASRPATLPDAILYTVAGLSLLAVLIHLWVATEHFEEWWGYGTFFIACAVLQGLYALLLLRRPGRKVLLVGAAGNLAVVILWLATRTTGIPLFGPHAGEIEEIGVPDLACTLAGVGIVTGLGILALRGLPTEGRLQLVVVTVASTLLFWHLLHLLGGSPAH